jgi:hypothetical protein
MCDVATDKCISRHPTKRMRIILLFLHSVNKKYPQRIVSLLPTEHEAKGAQTSNQGYQFLEKTIPREGGL